MNKNRIFTILLLVAAACVLSGCAGSSTLNNATSWPGITADSGIVYVAYTNSIEAIQDGSKLWNYPAEPDAKITYFAAPAIDGEKLFAGTYNNQIHVLNKADGTLIRSIEVGNGKSKIIASPIVADGKLIVLSSNGVITAYAIDNTMEQQWQTSLANETWVKAIFNDGMLYIAAIDKKIYELNANTGEIEQTWDTNGAIMSDVVLVDDCLYFSTLAKEVYELNVKTGETRTLITTDGEIWASPLVMEDKIIAVDMSGNIYCAELKTAEQLWKLDKVTVEGSGFIAAPVQLDVDSFLVIAENGDLMVYDTESKSEQMRSAAAKALTTPLVMNADTVVCAYVPGEALMKAYTFELKEDWVYSQNVKAPVDASTDAKNQSEEKK